MNSSRYKLILYGTRRDSPPASVYSFLDDFTAVVKGIESHSPNNDPVKKAGKLVMDAIKTAK